MAGPRRSPGGRPSGGPSGGRPSGGRPSGGTGATRRSTGPSSRSEGRVRTTTSRQRVGVEAGRDGGSGPRDGGGSSGGGGAGRGRGRGRPSVTGRAAVLALVVAVLLVSYAYPLRTWWDQHSERQDLEEQAERLAQEKERLERELELWDDPAFVAAQARDRLGFVMPGEQGYVVVPAEDDAADDGIDGLPPAGRGEWYERLWSSVDAADAVPETASMRDGATSERSTRGSDDAGEPDGSGESEGGGEDGR